MEFSYQAEFALQTGSYSSEFTGHELQADSYYILVQSLFDIIHSGWSQWL